MYVIGNKLIINRPTCESWNSLISHQRENTFNFWDNLNTLQFDESRWYRFWEQSKVIQGKIRWGKPKQGNWYFGKFFSKKMAWADCMWNTAFSYLHVYSFIYFFPNWSMPRSNMCCTASCLVLAVAFFVMYLTNIEVHSEEYYGYAEPGDTDDKRLVSHVFSFE